MPSILTEVTRQMPSMGGGRLWVGLRLLSVNIISADFALFNLRLLLSAHRSIWYSSAALELTSHYTYTLCVYFKRFLAVGPEGAKPLWSEGLLFPLSEFYPPFRIHYHSFWRFRIRILLSAFRILPMTSDISKMTQSIHTGYRTVKTVP